MILNIFYGYIVLVLSAQLFLTLALLRICISIAESAILGSEDIPPPLVPYDDTYYPDDPDSNERHH